jgi:imidazole glycerol-phosphate synthase subunit HisF
MMHHRIIARLDIKGPNLVKGINFEGLRVLGKPEFFAKKYYDGGADELVYMDAVASLYGRNSLLQIVERTSKEIFIPLTVGGGLRSLEDIHAVLRAGADKVALNTAAIANPNLIREASTRFGSSTILVSIEAIHHSNGKYEAYTNYGRDHTGVDAFDWARKAVEMGAGELMITAIHRDGTRKGFDLELTKKIAQSVPVPVIAAGGAGSPEHVREVIQDCNADAVSLATLLHYNVIQQSSMQGDFTDEGNIEFLLRKESSTKIAGSSILEIKTHLEARGVPCRPCQAALKT